MCSQVNVMVFCLLHLGWDVLVQRGPHIYWNNSIWHGTTDKQHHSVGKTIWGCNAVYEFCQCHPTWWTNCYISSISHTATKMLPWCWVLKVQFDLGSLILPLYISLYFLFGADFTANNSSVIDKMLIYRRYLTGW